eukprot:337143_1
MSKQQIGVVGMAVMGRNLALNIESRGYTVSIFNRSREKTEEVIAENPGKKLVPYYTVKEFVESLETPRRILLMVKAGAGTDAAIERYQNVGGGCTHWGTIPSKALRHAVSRIIEFNQNPLYSDHSRLLRSSFADILNHADNVINQQTRMRQGFYERNHCEILQGNARFVDEHTLALDCPDGSVETLTAEKFVIACGSRPYHPTDVDFTHPRIYDSDSILSMHHEPRHVLIYGAGVIGCEYASIFRGMDVKVDLINTRDRLLAFLDQEMSDSLSYHFWNSGVVIRHNEEYEKIEGCDDGVIMHLKSGKKLKADCLLYANGRTGNTDSLAL